jgi:Ca2+-binding EF-hand superfamily protein
MKKSAACSTLLCSITLAASAFAHPLAAQGASTPAAPPTASVSSEGVAPAADGVALLLATADRDHNGSVSSDELAAMLQASIGRRVQTRFAQLDRNHDGRVTRQEVPKMDAARFARFDANSDGSFTLTELSRALAAPASAHIQQLFARLDTDHDLRCSAVELAAALPQKADVAVASSTRTTSKPVELGKGPARSATF